MVMVMRNEDSNNISSSNATLAAVPVILPVVVTIRVLNTEGSKITIASKKRDETSK